MEAKKITWVEVAGRVLLFIPVVTIITYSAIKHWAIMVYNFVVYGGETAIYNDKMNRKTIVDVFNVANNITRNDKAAKDIYKSLFIKHAEAINDIAKDIENIKSKDTHPKESKYIFTSIEGNQQMITKQSATLQADGWELAGQISTVFSDNGNRMVIPFKKQI